MRESVAIVGGGIGGLATAHHLVRAGVENVTVYEATDKVGGKARSQYHKTPDGREYPGEHGFRFFPHFYRHLLETLRQIPAGGGSVYDRLVGPRTAAIAYEGGLLEVPRPLRIGPSLDFVQTTIKVLRRDEVSLSDATKFAAKLLQFATSCQARREQELDRVAWTKFTGAEDDEFSEGFTDVAIRASQNLSAMRAERSSAATIGAITLQLMFYFDDGEKPDALLCGPTDEMWLRDWHAYLAAAHGVRFVFGKKLTKLDLDRRAARITALRFGDEEVRADYYVSAIPLERLVAVLDRDLLEFDASLAILPNLAAEALGDMSGMQFFLRRPVPITNGHVHYPGTAFALTSVSQGQFWRTPPDRRQGTPELGDVLSVIISDWNTAGPGGKPASAYTDAGELAREVWRQMKTSLPPGMLDDDDVLAFHLDANVSLAPFRNRSPLLVHPVDQLRRRPNAETRVDNLFLAADFVRTHTDLATMEGADEAARRATRAILDKMGVGRADWPGVYPLEEGSIFALPKLVDSWLFELGLGHSMTETAAPLTDALATIRVDSRQAADPRMPHMLKRLTRLAGTQAASAEPLGRWERVLRNDGAAA